MHILFSGEILKDSLWSGNKVCVIKDFLPNIILEVVVVEIRWRLTKQHKDRKLLFTDNLSVCIEGAKGSKWNIMG